MKLSRIYARMSDQRSVARRMTIETRREETV